MAEQGALTTSKDGGKPLASLVDRRTAVCVDAAIQQMKTARFESPIDRAGTQPPGEQLAARYDTVLSSGPVCHGLFPPRSRPPSAGIGLHLLTFPGLTTHTGGQVWERSDFSPRLTLGSCNLRLLPGPKPRVGAGSAHLPGSRRGYSSWISEAISEATCLASPNSIEVFGS